MEETACKKSGANPEFFNCQRAIVCDMILSVLRSVAQLAEQVTLNHQVVGSSPTGPIGGNTPVFRAGGMPGFSFFH